MKSQWITHKGKRVFVFDCTNFGSNTAALEAEANLVAEALTKEPPDSVLSVTNSEGTTGTPANMVVLEKLAFRTSHHIHKRAVVGVSGIRKYLVDTVNRVSNGKPLITFDTMTEALDWLVK